MEQLRVMKTKDMMYLVNKRQSEKKVPLCFCAYCDLFLHLQPIPATISGPFILPRTLTLHLLQKIERLESTLHCLTTKGNPKEHTIFVDTHEEAQEFNPSEYFHTLPELLPRRFNRPTIEQLQSQVGHHNLIASFWAAVLSTLAALYFKFTPNDLYRR